MRDVIIGDEIVVTRDGKVALDRSSFRVPEASITAVIGPNGSGKSTLLHAVTGLLPLESGTLRVLDNLLLWQEKMSPTFSST